MSILKSFPIFGERVWVALLGIAGASGLVFGGFSWGNAGSDRAIDDVRESARFEVSKQREISQREIARSISDAEIRIRSAELEFKERKSTAIQKLRNEIQRLRDSHAENVRETEKRHQARLSMLVRSHSVELKKAVATAVRAAKADAERNFSSDERQLKQTATLLAILMQPEIFKNIDEETKSLIDQTARRIPESEIREAKRNLPDGVSLVVPRDCIENNVVFGMKLNSSVRHCESGMIVTLPTIFRPGNISLSISGDSQKIRVGDSRRFRRADCEAFYINYDLPSASKGQAVRRHRRSRRRSDRSELDDFTANISVNCN